jgi:cellobiose phosphorylase
MEKKLWRFTDNLGSFESQSADKIKSLYFPLANEALLSSISPDLHGDIKTSQDSFLLTPVSRSGLSDSRSSRNLWIYIDKNKVWSAAGVSKDLRQTGKDKFRLDAGLLWHKITRENKKMGLRAEVFSFVPAGDEPLEIMQVKITNISSRKVKFTPTAAIPIYARGANNLHDHRHVTSLLQRITLDKFGVIATAALAFDEAGHRPNKKSYFVLGWDEKFSAPRYIYPTQEMFCGDAGDLEAPLSVLENTLPQKKAHIQGREVMGALRFRSITLEEGHSRSYIIIMGITEDKAGIKSIINKFNSLDKIEDSLKRTQDFWVSASEQIKISTADADFDNWFRWVGIQPVLRKIFGCSFLPDFDYGKGGRGWRDLWQDCLGLILSSPKEARSILVNNFSGTRIDGSNATIIGKGEGEFISDRNNISRVWMDHAAWPLFTLDLYLNETGDFGILFQEASYFRNHEISRARERDINWSPAYGQRLKTKAGKIYQGTVLEHLLVQNLAQFFNVGRHNHLRLEGADWNDGLDMAGENGESVTFSAMYAYNLGLLADILLKTGLPQIKIARELKILLRRIDYNSIRGKNKILDEYFSRTKSAVSGNRVEIDCAALSRDLKVKSEWMMQHIRKSEWLKEGFFNGYYDNKARRVEGRRNNLVRMILTSQVFPIMSGLASSRQIEAILKNIEKYLLDKKLGGLHLNTDFRKEQPSLGRAFSFAYGDKENGAFFNHMVVMLAYALYKRGFAKKGWRVLSSIYKMATDTVKSKIYPCLPEYFNLEGRGMYSYLTGSASWFVLALLTEAFGIKGKDGDLLIEPKLSAEQFKDAPLISLNRAFAGRNLRFNFFNSAKTAPAGFRIIKASLNSRNLALKERAGLLISRQVILNLPANKINTLNIILG